MEEEFDPYLEAFINISKENDKKSRNTFILNNNKNQININTISNNQNPEEKDMEIDKVVEEDSKKINSSPNSLLGRKTKPDADLLDPPQISNLNNLTSANNNANNEVVKDYSTISIMNNKKNEEYEYGYSIIFLNDGEQGLMDDFLREKQNEPTTSDNFNYHLDEDKWIKILNHSILIHYERHIKEMKEEIEKRKKMQNMYNANTVNQQIIAPMSQMMFMNMGINNGVNVNVNYPSQMLLNKIPMQTMYTK